MLRAHARTDSRLSTHSYAEVLPTRALLAQARARTLAHTPHTPFVLSERAARRRALFQFVSPGEVEAHPRVVSNSRRGRRKTVAV
jgi:hypothetical protein